MKDKNKLFLITLLLIVLNFAEVLAQGRRNPHAPPPPPPNPHSVPIDSYMVVLLIVGILLGYFTIHKKAVQN